MCRSSPRTTSVPFTVAMTMVFSSKLSTSSTPEMVSCSRPLSRMWWAASAGRRLSSYAIIPTPLFFTIVWDKGGAYDFCGESFAVCGRRASFWMPRKKPKKHQGVGSGWAPVMGDRGYGKSKRRSGASSEPSPSDPLVTFPSLGKSLAARRRRNPPLFKNQLTRSATARLREYGRTARQRAGTGESRSGQTRGPRPPPPGPAARSQTTGTSAPRSDGTSRPRRRTPPGVYRAPPGALLAHPST